MHTSWIQTFLALVKTKNITDAAAQLFLSQSTVSSRLQQLEDYLGIKLFLRHKGQQQMSLTNEGANFVSLALSFIELDDTMKKIKFNEYSFPINLAATNSVVDTFLGDFILYLNNKSKYKYYMTTVTEHSHKIYEDIFENRIDFGLVTKYLDYPNLKVEKVLDLPLYIIQASTETKPIKNLLNDLKFSDYISIPWSDEARIWIENKFKFEKFPYINTDSVMHTFKLLKDNKWLLSPPTYFPLIPKNINYTYSRQNDYPNYQIYLVSNSKKVENNNLHKYYYSMLKSFIKDFASKY